MIKTSQLKTITIFDKQLLKFKTSSPSYFHAFYFSALFWLLAITRVSKFVNSDVLEQQVNQQFEQNISTVKHDDLYKTAHIKTFESQKNEELDALKCCKEKYKKEKKEKQHKILIHK